MSVAWAGLRQPRGNCSRAEFVRGRMAGVGGPRSFAASPQQTDAVLLPLLLALDAKCTPLCKQGFAFDGVRKNPGLGKTESKVILDE